MFGRRRSLFVAFRSIFSALKNSFGWEMFVPVEHKIIRILNIFAPQTCAWWVYLFDVKICGWIRCLGCICGVPSQQNQFHRHRRPRIGEWHRIIAQRVSKPFWLIHQVYRLLYFCTVELTSRILWVWVSSVPHVDPLKNDPLWICQIHETEIIEEGRTWVEEGGVGTWLGRGKKRGDGWRKGGKGVRRRERREQFCNLRDYSRFPLLFLFFHRLSSFGLILLCQYSLLSFSRRFWRVHFINHSHPDSFLSRDCEAGSSFLNKLEFSISTLQFIAFWCCCEIMFLLIGCLFGDQLCLRN